MDQFSTENLNVLVMDEDAAEIAERFPSANIDVPFTPAARRVLDRCVNSLADGDEAILTDHLLRAISATPESAAAQLIDEHGDSGAELLSALQTVLGQDVRDGDLATSPRLERVVIRAKREAFRHRHAEVSTLHLLMALLRERTAGFRS
jgi:ATP-dependent Clp protease ATP-binding subunit ClpA